MNIIQEFKSLWIKKTAEQKFEAQATLEDGTVIYTDTEFVEGAAIYFIDAETGELIPVPNGEYSIEGLVLVVEEGVASSVTEKSDESDKAEDTDEEMSKVNEEMSNEETPDADTSEIAKATEGDEKSNESDDKPELKKKVVTVTETFMEELAGLIDKKFQDQEAKISALKNEFNKYLEDDSPADDKIDSGIEKFSSKTKEGSSKTTLLDQMNRLSK
jgi:molecular chaperone DnaK (HSP70)